MRATVRAPVVVTGDAQRCEGATVDLSEGGAACLLPGTAGEFPVGSTVELALVLDAGRVWLRGVVLQSVVRRRAHVVTVRFLDPTERDRDLVRRHVFVALRRQRARGFR